MEEKHRIKDCSQKWSNLQKLYKARHAAEKCSGAAASEAWPFDPPIEALLCELIINAFISTFMGLQQTTINGCFWMCVTFHIFLFSEGRPMANGESQNN